MTAGRLKQTGLLKGLRPLPPTPADSRIFGFFYFSENVDLGNFPVGFGVWEGVESIDAWDSNGRILSPGGAIFVNVRLFS